MLGEDELGEKLPAWPLAVAPNWPSDGESVAPDRVGKRERTPPAKGWRIWGMQEGEMPIRLVRSSPQLYLPGRA